MDPIEETVIVKISIAGMAEEGLGTGVFQIDPMRPGGSMESLAEAVMSALADAMGDATPHVTNYFSEKYSSGGLDNEFGF